MANAAYDNILYMNFDFDTVVNDAHLPCSGFC